MPRVLGDDHYKESARVKVDEPLKELSILNGHESLF